ncbi:MAG TPA: NUDIX hydrolase [Candidatus Acidoferrales bacterium]
MPGSREYPDRPYVGVGGVVIEKGRTLLIRRANEPRQGEWSIPGGMVETGETLEYAVVRELQEETGLVVRPLGVVEVFERIMLDAKGRARFHFVLIDYLCERLEGEARASSDVLDVAWVEEARLADYEISAKAAEIIRKAFRQRAA